MTPKQISQDDLILFALQDMTPAEASEVQVHLEHSETARAELAQIQGDLATYGAGARTPPAPGVQGEKIGSRRARCLNRRRADIGSPRGPHIQK
jgi:hypothetical protein